MKRVILLKSRIIITALVLLSFSYHTDAQITFTPVNSVSNPLDSIVKNYLAGEAVEILSVDYLGNPLAIGSFINQDTFFPFPSGTVLSSGQVSQLGNPASYFASTSFGISTSYPDLAILTTGSIRDRVILEVTFIPFTDTLVFDWILGTEEYPSWIGSAYNDVFGFFLSGPGIQGFFTDNAVNLAVLPNGNSATINNIFTVPSFFVNNIGGLPPAFNGYSIPMKAVAVVQAFETYTMRIAVADVMDHIFDTGVFLKAGSLNVVYEFLTADGFQQNASDDLSSDGMISLNIQGGIPPYAILWSTGDTTPVVTGLATGIYTVTITDYINQEVNLEFMLFEPLETIVELADATCYGYSNGAISLNISGGWGAHDVLWSTGSTSSSLTGLSGGQYSVTITDQSGIPHVEQFEINEPDELTANFEITHALNAYNGSIAPTINGGTEPFTFNWSNGETTEENTYLGPGVYQLTITDANGCTFESSSIEIDFAYGDIEITGVIYHFNDLQTGLNAAGIHADNFQFQSGTDGHFNIEVPYHEAGIFVQPEKDDDALNGLTTFDAVLIARHILGVQTLPTPYHKIAADVNANGHIEIGDVIQLRRLILMIDSDFVNPFSGEKNNTSWRFVPLAFELSDSAPTSSIVPEFPEDVVVYADIDNNPVNLDFVGIKIGDVNGSANPYQFTAPGDAENSYVFLRNNYTVTLPNLHIKKGERYEVPVRIPMLHQMAGLQFGLTWDPELLHIKNAIPQNTPNFSQQNIHLNHTDHFMLVSWNGDTRFSNEDNFLMLEVEALVSGNLSDMLFTENELIRNEAYTEDLQHAHLDVLFSEAVHILEASVFPNPASGDVQLSLQLARGGEFSISLLDAAGKRIHQFEAHEWNAGSHELRIPARLFKVAGVYFINIESESFNDVQKLIYKP